MNCPDCRQPQPCGCGAVASPAETEAFRAKMEKGGLPARQGVVSLKPAIAPAGVAEKLGQLRLRLGESAYTARPCKICSGLHAQASCPLGVKMFEPAPRRGRSAQTSQRRR